MQSITSNNGGENSVLKIILCPVLICLCGYVGYILGKRFKNRVTQLELCELMLLKIKVYVECENIKTSEILRRLAESESLRPLTFIKLCNERLKENKNFPDMWCESLNSTKNELALKNDDYTLLKQLSEVIGSYDIDGVKNSIVVIMSEIKLRQKNAITENGTMGNLCKKLGVLTGLGVAIILI